MQRLQVSKPATIRSDGVETTPEAAGYLAVRPGAITKKERVDIANDHCDGSIMETESEMNAEEEEIN